MPRGQLTDEQKRSMQEARQRTKEQREQARQILQENPQFRNSKFWKSIDPELMDEVETAIQRVRKQQKKERIRKLEAELAELKGE